MNLAVICLAHLGAPHGVEMLARYFAQLDAPLFVHVDAKAKDAAYLPLPGRHRNVQLVRQRVEVYWGGFSMMLATIAALRQARATGPYGRYMLISENTIPLRTPAQLAAAMAEDAEFLHSYPVPNGASDPVRQRYETWYCFDSKATAAAEHVAPLSREVDDQAIERMQRLADLRRREKFPLPGLRHGSQWWALTDEAVAHVLDVHTTNPRLRQSFEFSAFPDEQYIQSILALSGWKRPCRPFIHTDFSRDPRPYIYRTREELEALRDGPYCMARKVDIAASGVAEYMQMITEG